MSIGEQTAKQIVIGEVDALVTKLQNGGGDNQQAQGQAMALLLKMFKPIYLAEYVTIETCIKQHEALLHVKRTAVKTDDAQDIKIKIGPLSIGGRFSQFIILMMLNLVCIGGVLFAIGKAEQWW